MQSYDARYASFTPSLRSKSSSRVTQPLRWPHPTSFLATPATLAAAGFYFNPSVATPDAVSCFICDKGLADWDPDDDPAQIHAQKCPKCPWAILKCVKDSGDHGSVKFPSRLPSSRVMEKARLATFGPEGKKWWPHDTKNRGPTSKMMAMAGFIYTPAGSKDDTCACTYCGIELGGWQPEDDPMEEHRSRQAKKGPCLFFTSSQGSSSATKRVRPKSKPPSTPPPASSSDHEYRPADARSTTRVPSNKRPGSSSENSKPSRKVSKKPAKAKAKTTEVIAEYDIALDEDAPPKPRPKPRRGSSRSRSRSSTRSTSTTTTTDQVEVASGKKSTKSLSAQDVEESQPKPGKGRGRLKVLKKVSNVDEDTQAGKGSQLDSIYHAGKRSINSGSRSRSRGSALSTTTGADETEVTLPYAGKPSLARDIEDSQPKRGTGRGRAKVLSKMDEERQPGKELLLNSSCDDGQGFFKGSAKSADMADYPTEYMRMKPTQLLPNVSTPMTTVWPHLNPSQSTEDEELAREEQALEAQARELLLVDTTYNALTPSDGPSTRGMERRNKAVLLKGKAESLPSEESIVTDGQNIPQTSTPNPPAPKVAYSGAMKFPQSCSQELVGSLTEAERAMTVEQWVRHEMNRQYERLRSDGRQKIDAFKARAAEAAKQIERL